MDYTLETYFRNRHANKNFWNGKCLYLKQLDGHLNINVLVAA